MQLILLLLAVLCEAGTVRSVPVVANPYRGGPVITPVNVVGALPLLKTTLNPALLANGVPVLSIVPVVVPTPQALIGPANNPAAAVLGTAQQISAQLNTESASPETTLSNFYDQGKASLGSPVDGSGSKLTQSAPQGLTGKALLLKLSEKTRAKYKTHEYDVASDQLFSTVDNVLRDGKHGVVDAYSGVFVPGRSKDGQDYPEPGDQNRDGEHDKGMNVEHLWPQSFFDKRIPMRSDLHHLLTTFIHPNGVRGHLPFGEVKGQGEYHNSAGAKMGQGVFEPPNFSKGKVARAMLYFYTKYHDKNIYNGAYNDQKFWNGNLEMFLRWNRQYPPDQDEKNRNDRIEQWQGNRNPYIDDYTLADQVGLEGFKRGSKDERLKQRYNTDSYEQAFRSQQQGKRKHKKRKHKNGTRWGR